MEWGEVMAEPKKPGTDRAEEVWRAWREMMELAVPGAEMQLPDLGEALGREMAQVAREQAERAKQNEQADEVANAARVEDLEIAVVRAAEKAGVADVPASVAVRADSDGAVSGGQVRRGADVATVAAGEGAVAGAVNVDIAGGGAVSARAVADEQADVQAGGVPEERRSVGSVRQWRAVSDIYGGAAGPLFVASGESGGQGSVVAERGGGAIGWWPGAVMAGGDSGSGDDSGGVSAELVEEVCERVVERLARALEVYVQSR